MGKAIHKPRPSPPKYVWWDLDNCWFCKNRKNCNQCKIMKGYVSDQKEKQNRIIKNKIKKLTNERY